MKSLNIKAIEFAQTVSEMGIYWKSKSKEKKNIRNSREAYHIFKPFYDNWGVMEQKEIFSVAYLNNDNKVIAVLKVSEGAATSTIVDIPFIFRGAIMTNAVAIILCHNHPSGKLNPSEQDKNITKQIIDAAKLLQMQIIDHMIITESEFENYYSFADEGII